MLSVEIPDILWLPIRETPDTDLISVDSPDISRLFPTSNWWVSETNTEIVLGFFLMNVSPSSFS